MYKNGLSYISSSLFVLLAHFAMLAVVFFNGNYKDTSVVLKLAEIVIGFDLVYFIVMLFYNQMTYSIDFMLLLVLNMSLIFQSCFGGVGLAAKHLITCIAAIIACRAGYLLCRNHKWIQTKKKYIFAANIIIILCILTLTGSRSMWIDLGVITIQPSEFLKPAFILACSTSVMEQQNKTRILGFNIVKTNAALLGLIILIVGLQWWCRDLGSLPTFIAIYGCGMVFRLCYPKAKLSKKLIIGIGAAAACAVIAALKFAPAYVQDRLNVDIWSDKTGNGYQQCRALIAIAEGGWFGKGAGHGSLYEVAASETDIVFSSICEEWGLLFALMMIIVIIIMLMLPLINPPRSYFHVTMTTGVCAAFIVQMALNIFGSCNMIPFTGVTIPFISQGGSSMVTSGFMIGMIIAGQSPVFKRPKAKKKSTANGGRK